MKRFKKAILALLAVIACSLCALVVACDNSLTVSFNTDGGSSIEAVKVENGAQYELPTPEKDGYRFEGWYLAQDFSGEKVTSITVTDNTTVYAKWTQLFTVTLDAKGGTLSQTTVVLTAGENVYNAVSTLTPVKTDNKFDAWYNNQTQLTTSYTMPEENITLTAKYKVAYKVEVYKQNAQLDGYEAPEVTTEYEFAGKTISPEVSLTGFVETQTDNSVYSIKLSENASENVIKLYFNREVYNVSFNTNLPNGESTVTSQEVTFGNSVNVPNDLTFDGYVLAGWSTTPNGDVEYPSNYIDNVAYKSETHVDGAAFSPERHTVLYAVWQKGYSDMFGSSDNIYLIGEKIYLSRGGVFFIGSYNAKDKTFEFVISDTNVLSGTFLTDQFYCYYDETRAVFTAYKFSYGFTQRGSFGGILEDDTYILLDGYNGIEMFNTNTEDGTTLSVLKGTYLIEDGYFYVTFTDRDGEAIKEEMTLFLGTLTDGRNVFMIKDEEAATLGKLTRAGMYNGQLVTYKPEYYSFVLDGFFTATYQVDTQTQDFIYYLDGDKLYIYDSNMALQIEARLVDFNGTKTYFIYDKEYDLDITTTDGATFVSDGLYNATYTKGETTISGMFEQNMVASFAGGNLFTIIQENGAKVTFRITATDVTPEPAEGEKPSEPVYEYEVEQIPEGYAEYCYFDGSSAYFKFYIILNEDEEGKANFYALNSETKEVVKVATGTYVLDQATGLYTYTITEHFNVVSDSEPIDVSKMSKIVFGVSNLEFSNGNTYDVMYLYSVTANDVDATVTDYTTVYTSTNYAQDSTTITTVGIFATLTVGDKSASGMYQIAESKLSETGYLIAVTFEDGSVLYAEINQEAKTITLFTENAYTAYRLNADGTTNQEETLVYNGKGGVTYTDAEGVVYVGSVVETELKTVLEAPVKQFVCDTKTFYFFELSASNTAYFSVWSQTAAKEYTSEEDGELFIDGCGLYLEYTDMLGNKYQGYYTIPEEGVIVGMFTTTTSQLYLYFDINGDKFTLRGLEEGTYLLMDNMNIDGTLINLDGYKTAKVYTVTTDEEGQPVENVIDTTEYVLTDGYITFTYTQGAKEITVKGVIGRYTSGGNTYNAIFIEHNEVVATYVTPEDWSVLVLDSLGNAKRYNTKGRVEYGTAMLITDTMLYYVNNSATNAGIYRYNTETGEAELVNFSPRSYYTSNFESLLFTKYGFAIFNGETRYYYDVDDNGNCVIYTRDKDNEKANEYGFIREEFGQFDATKQYNGKEYYITNADTLLFKRDEANADKYPLTYTDANNEKVKYNVTNLIFTPSGKPEMNGVQGTVVVGDRTRTCYVYRTLLEDGTYYSYVRIDNYYLDIELNYRGEDEFTAESKSTYSFSSLKSEIVYLPDTYHTMTVFGAMFGISIENTYGQIKLLEYYTEAGDGLGQTMYVDFYEKSGMIDMLGNAQFSIVSTEYFSTGSIVTVPFEKDGYQMCFHFTLVQNAYTGAVGYQVVAITNVQTLTVDGYTLRIEYSIASDSSNYVDRVYTLSLEKGTGEDAERIEYEAGYIISDTKLALYVYTYNDGTTVVNGGDYYEIDLTLKEYAEGETQPAAPIYTAVTITKTAMTIYYTAEGSSYVLMAGDKVVMYVVGSTKTPVSQSSYDSATSTYTFEIGGKTYTVTIADGKAVITEVVPTTPEENTEGNA